MKASGHYYDSLPTDLKPIHYDLSIFNVDLEQDTFEGLLKLRLKVEKPTDQIYLNYRDLSIDEAKVRAVRHTKGNKVDLEVKGLVEYKENEAFTIQLAQEITSSDEAVEISVSYGGRIQGNMTGFYKSTYSEGSETKTMLSTQFEATDARRAFPNMDEPALKATFNVDIEIRSDWCVLGNMPVSEEQDIGNGSKKVFFEKTPKMSTYLLAWACGDFEYVESHTKGIYYNDNPLPVRIYTTKGYKEDALLASEIAPKIIDYFSTIFDMKYPLPKLDLLAVHSFSMNAMENWGLITYRSTALLFSKKKSVPSYIQKVAYVVAHEIAHQWFGNLVTMQWWDELWLNEGFATWVGYLAIDHLFPEWDIFSYFVSESLQKALNLDGMKSSHPIEVPIKDALDIDEVFDAISYLKGASTIHMLSSYIGPKTFITGVAKYLNSNAYSNATSESLWASVSEVSGKDVSKMMKSWIKSIGFPVVDVTLNGGRLTLKQKRFLNDGDTSENHDKTLWWLPLYFAGDHKGSSSNTLDSLASKSVAIDNFELIGDIFKFNKDSAGVYRVNYSTEIFDSFILLNIDKFSVRDCVGVVADVSSLAISGRCRTTTFLDLIKSLANKRVFKKEEYALWMELGRRLAHFSCAFSGVNNSLTKKLQKFTQELYWEKSKMMLKASEEDGFLPASMREEILIKAGLAQVPHVYEYALKLFNSWKVSKTIPSSLRSFTFTTIASSENFDDEQFEALMKEVIEPSSLDGREIALVAMGNVTKLPLIKKLLAYLLDPSIVPTMDCHFLSEAMSRNVHARDELWYFFVENYDEFYANLSTSMVVLDRFVRLTLCNYATKERSNEIKEFFHNKDTRGFGRSCEQAIDSVQINAAWSTRDMDSVNGWFN